MAKILTRSSIVLVVVGTLVLITLGLLRPAQPDLPAQASISTTKNSRAAAVVGLLRGQAAPNFTVTTIDGHRVSLSNYRGKPVMLNFWMINCEGCRYEIPGMQRVYASQHAAHKDFVVLGVNLSDSSASIKQFARQHSLTYPLALDSNTTVAQLYALRGTPTSYFLDRKGIIHARAEGPVDEETLRQVIQQISA